WVRPPNSGWRQVHTEQSKLDPPSMVGFGRTEDTVMVMKTDDAGDRYHESSIANGSWSEPIAPLDNTDLIVDRVRRTVLGGVDSTNMKLRTVFLNPADQQLWARIERAFPGELVTLESWSDDRDKIALHVQGPKSGD